MTKTAVEWKQAFDGAVAEKEQLEVEATAHDDLIGELRDHLEDIRDGKNLWTTDGAASLVEAFRVLDELGP